MLNNKQRHAYYMGVYRAQKKGEIHTQVMRWNETYLRKERNHFGDVLKRVVKFITEECIIDNMKAPLANDAQPALLAPSSFDIYFGENVNHMEDDFFEMVLRTAYATGSGASSIGLDPRFGIIHHMFPDMVTLKNMVRYQVTRHYHNRNEIMNCNFNHVSVKLYFNGKVTRDHTDIEFNKEHTLPTSNNSQVPGTPVAILTFGDSKILAFTKYKVTPFGTVKVKDNRKRQVKFVQDSGTLILMDPRDELLKEDKTFWKHRSYLADPTHGVSVALMFRVIKSNSNVLPCSGNNPYAKVGGTGKKEKQFNDAWDWLEQHREEYENMRASIMEKIFSSMKKYY